MITVCFPACLASRGYQPWHGIPTALFRQFWRFRSGDLLEGARNLPLHVLLPNSIEWVCWPIWHYLFEAFLPIIMIDNLFCEEKLKRQGASELPINRFYGMFPGC